METVLALIGVVLGAALAPTLDWQRQRSRRREERRQEMLELVASYLALAGEWIGDLIKDQYTDGENAEQRLIAAAREHIANV